MKRVFLLSLLLMLILMASVPLMVFAQDDDSTPAPFFVTNTPSGEANTVTTTATEVPASLC